VKKVVVPVDYSESSLGVLRFAAEIAERAGGELTALHVWECMPHAPPDLKVRGPDGKPRRLEDVIRSNAEKEMQEFLAGAKLPASVPIRTKVVSGDAAKRVLERLNAGKHDLVVMGTHGRGGFKHMVLGSVAEKIIRESPVPVITVPIGKRES
jgi:nucleotide-binding universal stress UspA family protein